MNDENDPAEYGQPAVPAANPFKPERLEWVSRGEKCWATFMDLEDLSGKDFQALRKAAGSGGDNSGEGENELFAVALPMVIIEWEIGYMPSLMAPRFHKDGRRAIEAISARDLGRLERHIGPALKALLGVDEKEPESGPGSPPMPARD